MDKMQIVLLTVFMTVFSMVGFAANNKKKATEWIILWKVIFLTLFL